MKAALGLALSILTVASCSSGPATPSGNGTGGRPSTSGTGGGASASGGSTGSGGTETGSGGATTGSGGAVASGGTPGGTATGGASASGGETASGGMVGSGGKGASGGGAGTATGGKPATGGSASGGSTPTGGTPACAAPNVSLTGTDAVVGTLVQFNDNGGWCWYQDERVVVDKAAGKLVIGSVASGGSRTGNIEAVIYDLAAGTKKQATLGNLSVDDHAAPALAIRPDGKYVAMWAGHRIDCNSYYSVYDGSAWAPKSIFDWKTQGCPWDNDNTHMITYSNLWYMSAESRLYSGVRSVSTSPNFLASTNDGQSFSYYGRLSSTPTKGYVAGYYKYWGNGVDRIDFVGTEAHPRDNDNNLWHGYVKGGKIYNSAGTVIDDTVADMTGQDISRFTKVFATGSTLGGVKLSHAWNSDLVRYDDGTIGLIWTARANTTTSSSDPDLRLLYGRFDGTSWKLTYLVKAGPKLYDSEQDYTGLGALQPDDPTTIYISTPIDPRDDTTKLGKREIFRGTTCDNGATFKWTPVTQNSTKDNIRPVVPKWDANHTALLWLKGTYTSAQSYNMAVVGTISGR